MLKTYKDKIAVIGLGYVGLPLAVEFGKIYLTIGFDINTNRINDLKQRIDNTLEVDPEDMLKSKNLSFTSDPEIINNCNIFIITVPTPIDKNNQPDLSPLIKSSKTVSKFLKKQDIVIYESTVYPGATEEICIPILEKHSGLKFNQDFFCGYSPERINPGDKEHRLTNIMKVTSGSTPEIAERVDALYRSIIIAGTHKASSIKVAEAAKVIENTQRDVNIALINELAIIFNKLNIDTEEVLIAAGTKWNFIPFRPGLVGGHCIGVDPYYLTYKAIEAGYYPKMILAGRRLNNNMGSYIADHVVKLMIEKNIHVENANILIMGLTFKENCPDLRNTQVVDIIKQLHWYNSKVDVYDPLVNKDSAFKEHGIIPIESPENGVYDAIILAVAHHYFKTMGISVLRAFGKDNCVLYDIKYIMRLDQADGRL